MYCGVPITAAIPVIFWEMDAIFEMPKSRTLMRSLWPPVARHDEDVLRVHVAVNDPLQVRGGQRGAELIGDVDDARERQRTGAGQDLPQRFALEVLHHQVSRAVRQRVEVDDGHDRRMPQARGDLRFAHEAGQRLGMIAHAGMEKLHGVAVGQAFVGGLVDLSHPAASDAAHDSVRAAQQRTWLYTAPAIIAEPILMGPNGRFQRRGTPA